MQKTYKKVVISFKISIFALVNTTTVRIIWLPYLL